MCEQPINRLSLPIALTVLIGFGIAALATAPAALAEPQCLSEGECSALRAELDSLKNQIYSIKDQIKDFRSQLKALENRGSDEAKALKGQIKQLRRDIRPLRHDLQAARKQHRKGCLRPPCRS